MSILLKELFEEHTMDDVTWMQDIHISRVRFYRSSNKMELFIKNETPLTFDQYREVIHKVKELCHCTTVLFVECTNQVLSQNELYKYLNVFYHVKKTCAPFISATTIYEQEVNRVTFQFLNEHDLEQIGRASCRERV